MQVCLSWLPGSQPQGLQMQADIAAYVLLNQRQHVTLICLINTPHCLLCKVEIPFNKDYLLCKMQCLDLVKQCKSVYSPMQPIIFQLLAGIKKVYLFILPLMEFP